LFDKKQKRRRRGAIVKRSPAEKAGIREAFCVGKD
jgi:hypothetical protein